MRSRYRDGHCMGLAGVLQRAPLRSAIWRCRQAVATGEGGEPRPEFRLPQRRLSQATLQIAELLRVVSSRPLHRSHHSKDGLALALIGARARREVRVIAGIVVHLCFRPSIRRAHANAEPHWLDLLWLRICVAFGVLRDIPTPSGDRLVSLRPSRSARTCMAEPGETCDGSGLMPMPGFRLPAFYYTLQPPAGRRLPPACERLAKHPGDGSGRILGTGPGSGDERSDK